MPDGGLLWQVACEFIAASRKLTDMGYTQAQAWGELEQLRRLWQVILPSEDVLLRAERLTASHNLSFWDSLLACIEGGITRLYTEDFDASLSKAIGIEIINPF
jgi:predicted nucleic acid-binding protein